MRVAPSIIWALGVTQIIGYGSLYYSFSVLSEAIGESLSWSTQWVFAALSVALLAGGFLAPLAGKLMDRHGAANVMTIGSVLAAIALALTALAPNGYTFAGGVIAIELVSTFVLYAAAFAALVELGGKSAQASIVHLTLIAGFASTIFWPLTSWLSGFMDWREIYLVFAGLNLFVCAPLHYWIAAHITTHKKANAEAAILPSGGRATDTPTLSGQRKNLVFGLLLAGFAIEGFLLSGILLQIMPLLNTIGLAASSVLITTLFGPAQVLSRLINMMLGKGLRQTHLGIITALLLPIALAVLAMTAPIVAGAVVFAVLFGLGSGLTSIISGSLPLELFGRQGYGSRLGWMSSARQIASAIAPFMLASSIAGIGASATLSLCVALGTVAVLLFASVAYLARVLPAPAGAKAAGLS